MKEQFTIFVITFIIGISSLKAQTNIGSQSNPDASAQLQISTTTLGVLMPRVSLTATTTFTLAGNTKTAGMVVYNTNAGITGTTAYPAYGTGLYTWDGTGWKGTSAATFPQTVLVAYGTAKPSPTTYAFSVSPLDLSTVALNATDKVTISGNTLTILVAGTYKIDVIVQSIMSKDAFTNSGTPWVDAQITNATTSTVLVQSQAPAFYAGVYSLPISYVGVIAANTKLILEGQVYGSDNGGNFQVTSLQVQQIK